MPDPTVFRNAFTALSTSTGSAASANLQGNKSVSLPLSRAELDDAVMGDDIAATYPGILSAPISLEHRQDFTTAATGVDKKLWNLLNNRTAIRFKTRAVNSAVSSTNPSYLWSRVYVSAVTPLSGRHGELLVNRIELRPMSGCTVTRSTST